MFPGFILKLRQENIHFVQNDSRNFLLWLRWPLEEVSRPPWAARLWDALGRDPVASWALCLHCDISASDLSKRFRAGFAKTWLSSFILSLCNPWMHLSPWLLLLFCPWCGWRCCWGGTSKAASHPTWQQAEGPLGIFSPHSIDDTGFPLPLHQLLMLPEEQNLLAVLILRFNGVVTFCS